MLFDYVRTLLKYMSAIITDAASLLASSWSMRSQIRKHSAVLLICFKQKQMYL